MRARKTNEQYIKECVSVHGDKYGYNNTFYVNNKTKVTVTCKIHGDFEILSANHIKCQGCRVCGHLKKGNSIRENIIDKRLSSLQQPKDYKVIPLSKGKFAKVDNEDFEVVKDFNWCLSKNGYAFSNIGGYMHRLIMNPPKDMEVDHIDRNKLDNRRYNLRICTHIENMRYLHSTKHKHLKSNTNGN